VALLVGVSTLRSGREAIQATVRHQATSLQSLLALSDVERARMDVGLMNLLCAEGLPNSGNWDWNTLLKQLDVWAARIRTETEKHLYRFHSNPAEFENSEAFFRLLKMTVAVQENFLTAAGHSFLVRSYFHCS